MIESNSATNGEVLRRTTPAAPGRACCCCRVSTPATMQSWQYGKPRMRWSHAGQSGRPQRLHCTTARFVRWYAQFIRPDANSFAPVPALLLLLLPLRLRAVRLLLLLLLTRAVRVLRLRRGDQ